MMNNNGSSQSQPHNLLLASLPEDVMQRLRPSLELCILPLGKVLYESGDPLRHVYFPIDSIVSLLNATADGDSAEISVVGNEGLIGINLFMGALHSPTKVVVQNTGSAYCLAQHAALAEFERYTEFMKLVLRYTHTAISQFAQTAACIGHHPLQQRLCRWLLQSLDRRSTPDLYITHELIAAMLGVRRESVSAAIANLQSMGVIEHHRRHIRVLNRVRLEKMSCECYQVVKAETDRLPSGPLILTR